LNILKNTSFARGYWERSPESNVQSQKF